MDEMNIDLIDDFKKIMDENEDVVKISMTPYAKRNFKGEIFSDNLIQTRHGNYKGYDYIINE